MNNVFVCSAFAALCLWGVGFYGALPGPIPGHHAVFMFAIFALGTFGLGGAFDRLAEWKEAQDPKNKIVQPTDDSSVLTVWFVLALLAGGAFILSGTNMIGFLLPFLSGCALLALSFYRYVAYLERCKVKA